MAAYAVESRVESIVFLSLLRFVLSVGNCIFWVVTRYQRVTGHEC